MTSRKLGLLVVFTLQFISDGVQQLNIALLRKLGQRRDEGLMISLLRASNVDDSRMTLLR